MSSDFKKKAQAEVERSKNEERQSKESQARYVQAVRSEYPRLCKEALELTTQVIEGTGIDLESFDRTLDLDGELSRQQAIGNVDVPFWAVRLGRTTIQFIPSGVNYFGVRGKIEVKITRAPNPNVIFSTGGSKPPEIDGIWMIRSEEEGKWALAISEGRGYRPLTEEWFEDLFTVYLLERPVRTTRGSKHR